MEKILLQSTDKICEEIKKLIDKKNTDDAINTYFQNISSTYKLYQICIIAYRSIVAENKTNKVISVREISYENNLYNLLKKASNNFNYLKAYFINNVSFFKEMVNICYHFANLSVFRKQEIIIISKNKCDEFANICPDIMIDYSKAIAKNNLSDYRKNYQVETSKFDKHDMMQYGQQFCLDELMRHFTVLQEYQFANYSENISELLRKVNSDASFFEVMQDKDLLKDLISEYLGIDECYNDSSYFPTSKVNTDIIDNSDNEKLRDDVKNILENSKNYNDDCLFIFKKIINDPNCEKKLKQISVIAYRYLLLDIKTNVAITTDEAFFVNNLSNIILNTSNSAFTLKDYFSKNMELFVKLLTHYHLFILLPSLHKKEVIVSTMRECQKFEKILPELINDNRAYDKDTNMIDYYNNYVEEKNLFTDTSNDVLTHQTCINDLVRHLEFLEQYRQKNYERNTCELAKYFSMSSPIIRGSELRIEQFELLIEKYMDNKYHHDKIFYFKKRNDVTEENSKNKKIIYLKK